MGLIENRDLYLIEVDGLDYTYKCLATVRTAVNYENGMCFDLLEEYSPAEIFKAKQGVAFVRHECYKKVPTTYTATYKQKGYAEQVVTKLPEVVGTRLVGGTGALKYM